MLKILSREGLKMKKMIKIPMIFLALFIFIFMSSYTVKAEEAPEFNIGSLFNDSKAKLKENTFIMDYKYDDVNGDHIKDSIILVGQKREKLDEFERDYIKILVQDGKSKKYYKLSPGNFTRGDNGKLFLGDFNGDNILDIFVSFCGRGDEDYPWYSLISFKKNKVNSLFDQKHFTLGLSFDVSFVDDYKVSVFNRELSKFYTIAVDNKKDTYNHAGIYNDKGELLGKAKGITDSISELRPVDIDKDGIYELVGMQSFCGICNEDIIGYAKSVWRYESSKMKLLSLEIIPYATPGGLKKVQRIVPVMNLK
jgi:hypothetical protein